MFVAIASRQAKPEFRKELIEGFIDQAHNSLQNEPGCLVFHVIQDAGNPNRIWLYEVFRDEEAFKAHTQMPHSRQWAARSREWRDEPPQGATLGSYNLWPSDAEVARISPKA